MLVSRPSPRRVPHLDGLRRRVLPALLVLLLLLGAAVHVALAVRFLRELETAVTADVLVLAP